MAKRTTVATVTLDVILRGQAPSTVEECVGTITVPVTMSPLGGATVENEAIERALGSFGDEHVAPDTTRRRRRGSKKGNR